MMLEAEGEGKPWCMQLLRHEAGHAFSYAYNLHKKRQWQNIFGSPKEEGTGAINSNLTAKAMCVI